jgi:hypothetical protein
MDNVEPIPARDEDFLARLVQPEIADRTTAYRGAGISRILDGHAFSPLPV